MRQPDPLMQRENQRSLQREHVVPPRRVMALGCLCVLLQACGTKGALYYPVPKPDTPPRRSPR